MKVVIADDHDLVIDALASLVKRDDENSQVLKAGNFGDALEVVENDPDVDVVLLDVYMPGMRNLESVGELTGRFPDLPVVLMSGLVKAADVDRGFELGARGFVPKTMNGKALLSVLRLVMTGAKYVPELVLEQEPEPQEPEVKLSKREMEVLAQLAKGLANKAIARNLGIEASTVKLHLRTIFSKLGASNRTEAVIAAINFGLLKVDSKESKL